MYRDYMPKTSSDISLEKSALLEDNDGSNYEEDMFPPKALQEQRSFYRRNRRAVLGHIALFALNVLFCVVVQQLAANGRCHMPMLDYIQAQGELIYEARVWDWENIYMANGERNPAHKTEYIGPPSEALDDAWQDLLKSQNVVLTRDELGELGKKKGLAELADGSGVYSTLTVYHALHCVKQVHHFLYYDHYYPNATTTEKKFTGQHAEHCLDIIRQHVQCHPDLSVMPMQWAKKTRIPIGLDIAQHECVDFDSLQRWMAKRSFDPFKPGTLVHPTLGEAYKYGGQNIGIVADELISESHDHLGR